MHITKFTPQSHRDTSLGGALAGDVGGVIGATTVTGIQGIPVSATPPTDGQELVFDGTQWAPADDAPSGLTSVTDGTVTVSPATSLQVPNQSLANGGAGLAIVRWDRLQTIAVAGAAQTLDLSAYDAFDLTLTANCTLTFTNPPTSGVDRVWAFVIRQGGSGSYTITWPAAVSWPASDGTPTATPPALFTVVTAINVVVMDTFDGGTSYGANLVGSGTGTTTTVSAVDHTHVDDVLMSGDGSTVAFELPAAPFDAYSVQAFVAGTLTEVTLSGALLTTATFGSAPASAANNIRFDIVAAVV
jgi:hypothetical protein